mmetsp:Transcript_29792/g.97071  ORF Transcript_29792/g.97071 Transcript_29792/m.97071 type:complete len:215 (+) Transcript_29792:931-1575(+)
MLAAIDPRLSSPGAGGASTSTASSLLSTASWPLAPASASAAAAAAAAEASSALTPAAESRCRSSTDLRASEPRCARSECTSERSTTPSRTRCTISPLRRMLKSAREMVSILQALVQTIEYGCFVPSMAETIPKQSCSVKVAIWTCIKLFFGPGFITAVGPVIIGIDEPVGTIDLPAVSSTPSTSTGSKSPTHSPLTMIQSCAHTVSCFTMTCPG